MGITVEISYYPLHSEYQKPVMDFLSGLSENQQLIIEPGVMSTLISGEYDEVMKCLHKTIKPFMEEYNSVFTIKMGNACKTK
jgi:uncharacterized protein YqgV (UPF0045/DUF77 family)